MSSYDAILIVAFGGPEGPDEVAAFLENVLRGKDVPRERFEQVAGHYRQFGGKSPIHEQVRCLIAALVDLLNREGPHLPVYWGNRNWHPLLADTLARMADDGVRHALAFFTSAYSSYSCCRQYLEDIQRAQAAVGDAAPRVDKLRAYYNHPGFIEPMVDRVGEALNQVDPARREATPILFTAHSIPSAMAAGCRYESQLREACRLVGEGVDHANWRLVYQSRSGPPRQRWLEPDVCDALRDLHAQGQVADVVVMPIGFISDHLEVLFDLDTQARRVCEELGLNMARAATVGNDPRFVAMIRELVLERLSDAPTRRTLGHDGPSHDVCPVDCCPLHP